MSLPPDRARVAILNGFGRSLGDSVVGLQALYVALQSGALQSGALPNRPVLFRLPDLPASVQGVYAAAADLCEVRTLPWHHATPEHAFPPAAGFGRVIDLRDFAFDPGFRGLAMIDYFLGRLDLDATRIPAARRRNTWLAARARPRPVAGLGRGYVLVCPTASMRLRDMPVAVQAPLLRWLLTWSGRPVVTQGTPAGAALAAPPAADFAELCGLVADASLVVSVDTAMVHLADAFSIPCLAFFTTHRPEWRVRDYPLCRALHIPVPGLPDALEFARGPQDEAAAQQAWPDFAGLMPTLAAAAAAFARHAD